MAIFIVGVCWSLETQDQRLSLVIPRLGAVLLMAVTVKEEPTGILNKSQHLYKKAW